MSSYGSAFRTWNKKRDRLKYCKITSFIEKNISLKQRVSSFVHCNKILIWKIRRMNFFTTQIRFKKIGMVLLISIFFFFNEVEAQEQIVEVKAYTNLIEASKILRMFVFCIWTVKDLKIFRDKSEIYKI